MYTGSISTASSLKLKTCQLSWWGMTVAMVMCDVCAIVTDLGVYDAVRGENEAEYVMLCSALLSVGFFSQRIL